MIEDSQCSGLSASLGLEGFMNLDGKFRIVKPQYQDNRGVAGTLLTLTKPFQTYSECCDV